MLHSVMSRIVETERMGHLVASIILLYGCSGISIIDKGQGG